MKTTSSIKTRFVVVDVITGGEITEYLRFEDEAIEMIPQLEQNDKEAGCYEPNSHKVETIEII